MDTSAPPGAHTDADLTLEYLMRRMRFKSDFPALSTSITRLQALSQSETDSLQTLCDEILQDVALTQKLLRVVNTAHYRRAGSDPISTISRAVSVIGVAGVRNIALSLMLLDRMQDKAHAQQLKVEFLRTVMAGTLASELSTTATEAEEAFIGTLFSNLGRLLLAYYLPEDAEQIRQLTQPEGQGAQPRADALDLAAREAQATQQVLGVTLEALANAVGRSWGLSEALLTCMCGPQGPVPTVRLATAQLRMPWLAHVASQAAQRMLHTEPAQLGQALQAVSAAHEVALGLTPQALQDAAGRARLRLSDLCKVLDLSVPASSSAQRFLDHFYVDTPHAADPGSLDLDVDVAEWTHDPVAILQSGIQDIANALVESYKLNDVLTMVLETMYRSLACRRVVFCLRDAKTGALLGRMGMGEGADVLKAAFNIPLSCAAGQTPDLFAAVCLKNLDTLISDAHTPAMRARLPAWFSQHIDAPTFLLLPLFMRRDAGPGLVLGLIYADQAEAGSLHPSPQELALLATLRNQALTAFKGASGG